MSLTNQQEDELLKKRHEIERIIDAWMKEILKRRRADGLFKKYHDIENLVNRLILLSLAEPCFDGSKNKRFRRKIIKNSLLLERKVTEIIKLTVQLYAQ